MQNTLNPSFSRSRSGPKWWHDPSIRIPVMIFLTARILTLLIAFVAVRLGTVYNPYATDPIFTASMRAVQTQGPLYPLIEPWQRWDTGWYMKIARFGYAPDDGSIIFAPLYPIFMAGGGLLTGDYLFGGLIVSSVTCLLFLIVLYKLVLLETGTSTATQFTLLTLITFPTAFYMLAAYTEGLFLALVAGTFLAARQQRWWLAALLSAGAALTRLQGWVLFFSLGWMAFIEAPRFWQTAGSNWATRIRRAIPRLAATGAAPLFTLVFLIYLSVANLGGLTDAYTKPWGMDVRPPWSAVVDLIGRIGIGQAKPTEIAGLVALVFITGMMLASLRTLPIRYHLYLWPTLILILLRYYPLYLLNGTMRYVLDFFPIFITLGLWFSRRPRWRLVWLVVGAVVQLWFIYLFARWQWIS